MRAIAMHSSKFQLQRDLQNIKSRFVCVYVGGGGIYIANGFISGACTKT